MFRQQKVNRPSNRKGAVAVEFALMAPVLMTIVMGLIQTTAMYDAQNMLETAAREGARFAAMDREGMLEDGQTSNEKVSQDIRNFLASFGLDPNDVLVSILDYEDTTQTFDLDDPDNDLKLFQLEVTVPYSSISYTPVSESNDSGLTGTIVFRNGRATISE